jgi:hypothetical protein
VVIDRELMKLNDGVLGLHCYGRRRTFMDLAAGWVSCVLLYRGLLIWQKIVRLTTERLLILGRG